MKQDNRWRLGLCSLPDDLLQVTMLNNTYRPLNDGSIVSETKGLAVKWSCKGDRPAVVI